MNGKYIIIFLLLIVMLTISCTSKEESETITPAKVSFINHSSFQTDIYKNHNPEHYDPSTLVATVNSGATQVIEQNPSFDQIIGDTFYPRYKIKLADSLQPGITTNIFVDAQRLMTNITFVIESGKNYQRQIPQPEKGELNFFHGYIEIQNQSAGQIQIIRGGAPLLRLDNNALYLAPGQIGFYEIEFSSFGTGILMSQLQVFGNNYFDFPTFTAERGKLYRFDFKSDNTVVWKTIEPVKNLDPL